MAELFAYDRARLDARLLDWVRRRHPTIDDLEAAATLPGFSGGDLSASRGAQHFGKVSSHLWALTYWLFVGSGDPVVVHPAAGAEAKSVMVADVGHRPIAWDGIAYLSVWANLGRGTGQSVLVPFPHVHDVLIGKAVESFRSAHEALHQAAIDCTARVNLVWPTALALAASDPQ